MATEADLNQDDDQKDDQSQPLATGGGSAAPDVGSSPSAGAPTTNRAAPTSRPNIQQYINANSNAGQNLATGISNQNSRQTDQFNNQVSKTNDQLNKQSQPLQNNLGENGSNLIQQSFKDPSAILKNEDQLGQFSKLRDQGYQGDISNLQANGQQAQNQLQSSLGNLQGAASNAGTESGRFQLLRNSFGQPNYSNGQQKLDQLFLQTQPGASAGLQQNLTNNANTAGNQLKASTSDFQNKLNALNTLSGQDSANIKDLFTNGVQGSTDLNSMGFNGINADVQNKIAAGTVAAADQPRILQALKDNKNLTQADIDSLGLNGTSNIYNLNLGDYASQSAKGAPNAADVASNDEIARFQALGQLSGSNAPADPFGGATTNTGWKPVDFDNTRMQSDLANAQKQYTDAQTSLTGGQATQDLGKYFADLGWHMPSTGNTIQGLQDQLNMYKNSISPGTYNQVINGTYPSSDTPLFKNVYDTLQKYNNLNGTRKLNT